MGLLETFQEILIDYLLITSVVSGILLWFFVKMIKPYTFLPIALMAYPLDKSADARERKYVADVFPIYMLKFLISVAMIYFWTTEFLLKFSGWEDWQNWDRYCEALPLDHPEFVPVTWLYYMYFTYLFWVTIGDLLKDRKNEGIAQYAFDCHHIVAILLIYYSYSSGYWRGGFLTRIAHDPPDAMVYISKIIEVIYKKRFNTKKSLFMGIVATFNFLLFFVLRVIVYGYMVYKWWFLYLSEKSFVLLLLFTGSFVMYILQWVFCLGTFMGVLGYCCNVEKAKKDQFHSEIKESKKKAA